MTSNIMIGSMPQVFFRELLQEGCVFVVKRQDQDAHLTPSSPFKSDTVSAWIGDFDDSLVPNHLYTIVGLETEEEPKKTYHLFRFKLLNLTTGLIESCLFWGRNQDITNQLLFGLTIEQS